MTKDLWGYGVPGPGERTASGEGYRIQHRPGGPGFGAPFHDLNQLWGEDIYEHPEWYDGMTGYGIEGIKRQLNEARNNPDFPVTIYRAMPPGITDINTGDWVTPSLSYARRHAIQDWTVTKTTVPAKHLWTDSDLHEWGYHGPSHQGEMFDGDLPHRTAAQWTPLIDDDGSEMLDHPSGMKALTFPGNGNGVHHWHVRSRSGKNVAKGRSATPQEAESSALHVMENPPPPYRYGPDDLEFGRYRHRGTDYQDGMAMVWPRGEFHGPDNWLSAITWGPSGEIGNVETHPDHRRRGLATQLFDYVKQNHRPDLRHSPTLSEDGKAWSRYEQSRTAARRTVAQRQLLHRGIPFPEGWVPAPDQFINSVGQHWTSDLSVAEAFSDPVTYGESFGSPDDNEYYRGTGAVVSAWHDPATAKPITDKEILHKLHGGDYPEDKEVTFSSGAPLEVHSIKYLPVGGQEWKEISGVQGNGITAHRTAMPTYYHRSPTRLQEQRPDRAMPHTYFYTAVDPHDVDWETRAYGDQVYAAEFPDEVMEPDPAPRRAQESPVRWWRTDPANVGDMTHLYDPTAPFGLPTKKVRP